MPEPTPPGEPPTDKKDWQAPVLPPIASPSANAGKVPEGVPGAIMRATVDRTTYLTYGLETDESARFACVRLLFPTFKRRHERACL